MPSGFSACIASVRPVGSWSALTRWDPIEPISHQGSGWAPRKLPERLRATYRKHGGVRYLIADNLPAHKAHDIRQWAENNNVKMIFTRPTSAS